MCCSYLLTYIARKTRKWIPELGGKFKEMNKIIRNYRDVLSRTKLLAGLNIYPDFDGVVRPLRVQQADIPAPQPKPLHEKTSN